MNDNKLIAEFMGYESYQFREYTMYVYEENNHRTDIDLHYHTSWGWLMPVVEKIKDMGYDQELDNIDNVLTCDLRIENLYNRVVEFIKFYNDQNK